MSSLYNETKIITLNKYINTRHASNLVAKLESIQSSVYLNKIHEYSRQVNAKSIIGLLSLGLKRGDEVVVTVLNQDENNCKEDILKALEIVINL